MEIGNLITAVGTAIDVSGVVIIVLGALLVTVQFGYRMLRGGQIHETYRLYRQGLGRAILLGLEFLVAADIIRTVAVTPTFRSVGVLGVIVVVRTFLSFSLEVELEGRWPWQGRRQSDQQPAADSEPAASPS